MEVILHRALILSLAAVAAVNADNGHDAWLRYQPQPDFTPAVVSTTNNSLLITTARVELIRGLGRKIRIASSIPKEDAIILGTIDKLPQEWNLQADLPPDSYWLKTVDRAGILYTVITGPNDRGVLYGVFAFLRKIELDEPVTLLDEKQSPAAPLRWVNQWDNLDGSIERGYGG